MQRRVFLATAGTATTLGLTGCVGTDRETVPQDESFNHGDIRYTVSGRATTDEVWVGSTRYMPRPGKNQIIIGIDMSQENMTDDPVQIDTGGEIETPEGDTFDATEKLYGSEEIPPNGRVIGSMAFTVLNEYEKWKFVIKDSSLFGTSYEVMIPKED